MSPRAGQRLLSFAEAVHRSILSAPVKHLDETGFRITGSSLGRTGDGPDRIPNAKGALCDRR